MTAVSEATAHVSSQEDVAALLDSARERAGRYLASLNTRAVAPDPVAVTRLNDLQHPLATDGLPAQDILGLLDEYVTPATMAMAGPRFFGFVIGGSLPVTLAANWLAAAWDQNAGLQASTPGVAHLEIVALEWLKQVLGLPTSTQGAFVTGGTMANFTALAAARHHVLHGAGWDVERHGLFGAPPVAVVVGEEAHPTLFKSLGLLGFGRDRVVRIPVDGQGRMRPDAVQEFFTEHRGPAIVCTQAGNVNTGAFDPIGEICAISKSQGAWVHVDGAFGLWARATPTRAALARGIEGADSWATDAHKWLNVPYDSGLAFVRTPGVLPAAMAISAAYLPSATQGRNPSDFTPELSRRARGVEVWAALRHLGTRGVAELIERTCRHAQRFAAALGERGYAVLNDVVLNQVLVSFGSAEQTEQVIDGLQREGTCWCGTTFWQGHRAMRISVSSWATTAADVEKSIAAIIRVAGQVCG